MDSTRIETNIPQRLDRLPWSRWHLRVVGALSVTWLLDGLEGSLGGSLAGALKSGNGLGLSDAQLGVSSAFYLAGAVTGALVFGALADRYGRKRLFSWTLVLYLCATAATGLSWNLLSFTCFRVLTGAGIGGEYAAINSAIDEVIPARLRGRVDLWINATFWLGIMLGSVVSSVFLSASVLGERLGWRFGFCSGLPIGIAVLFLRRYIPESPRWLLTRGRQGEAEAVLHEIELEVSKERGALPPVAQTTSVTICASSSLVRAMRVFAGAYRSRALLCLALMTAQAFFYNSVFFSLALVLLHFYGVASARVGLLFLPIAIANFLGPAMLGVLFDRIGRKQMICATYCLSGAVLLVSSGLFYQARLGTVGQIAWWATVFFFASSAASSAYLTVSEVFPQEMRATAIAVFYALGTLAGGVFGPLVFGRLTQLTSRTPLFAGYVAGAVVMIAAGMAQAVWGVAAESKALEAVALPEL